MFTTNCFIRKNTPSLREKLEELGYKLCDCTKSLNSNDWLLTYNSGIVHVISRLEQGDYMAEVTNGISLDVDCGYNEELFLALAALRDDTDHKQWFTNGKEWIMYMDDTCEGGLPGFQYFSMPRDINLENFHKATPNEIIAHFKQKES